MSDAEVTAWLKARMTDPRLSDAQRERDALGRGNLCAACGGAASVGNLLVISAGDRVHEGCAS